MKHYDVVFYAYWVHSSHVHKYLALHNRLKKHCNVLTIIAKEHFGITEEEFRQFKAEDVEGVLHLEMDDALGKLREVDFKVGIFSSNGRKGWVGEDEDPEPLGRKDIDIAREKGAVSIQISEMITDFYYAGADIASLVSQEGVDWHLKYGGHRYQWRPFDANPQPNYMFSNCLLWDNTEECLPYKLTREQFCHKYGLDPSKDFFVWLPDTIINLFRGTEQSELYRNTYEKVCSLDNIVVKLHPHDYKGLHYFKFDNKHSSEHFAGKDISVVESIDTHWCYKYAACGISLQSSVSIEFPMYRTPFLYVDNGDSTMPWKRLFTGLAHHCTSGELDEFIKDKKYEKEIEGMHSYYDERIVFDSSKKALDILTEQVVQILKST